MSEWRCNKCGNEWAGDALTECASCKAKNSFTAPAGWALLAEHIRCELSKARQSKRKAERACAKEAVDYWTGNIVALTNLRKAFATELKAKPNSAICEL
jgi:hypothetical protein